MPAARAASSAVCRLGTIGARPGTCSAYSSLTRSLVPITKQLSRCDPRAIARASRMAIGVSIIAQSVVWSGAPYLSRASTSWATSAALLTLGTTTASGPACAAASRSASCHSVPMPLTRMVRVRRPYSPLDAAAAADSRAAGLASGATASSRSKITASIGSVLAFSSALALELGM